MTLSDFLRIASLIDTPSTVLLGMLFVGLIWAEKAQKDPDFDWGEMFRNGAGKLDWRSFAGIGCFALTSWVLIYVFMNGIRNSDDADGLVKVIHEEFWYFVAYMLLWGMGPKFVDKLADALIAKWSPTTVSTASVNGMSKTDVTAAAGTNVSTAAAGTKS